MSDRIALRHVRAGWWGLAVFVALGAALELLHAVKAPFYLDAGRETTRLLLRLAHAHGTGLSLVNLAFGLTARAYPAVAQPFASTCLLASTILIPAGFFLGGVWAQRSDPGLGILLVPAGAALLFAGLVTIARSTTA